MNTNFNFELNSRGYIKQRESQFLEFKENFHLGNNILKYLRSLVGMANNQGGEIIFGIQDSPRIPLGLKNDKFDRCDPANVTQLINDHFSSEIEWKMETIEFDDSIFGRFSVNEAKYKPIVCKKNNSEGSLREGAIYYRYRGQTAEIKYPELSRILQEEKEKEKRLWISHIEKMGEIGLQNVHLLDSYKGEIHTGNNKILIDKAIIQQLKFIREGQFVEKDGAPTLKLIGEVQGIIDAKTIVATDDIYPLRNKEISEEFNFNNYEMKAILWKLKIKGDKQYHNKILNGKSYLHKYSSSVIDLIKKEIRSDSNFKIKTTAEYKELNKS